MSVELLNECKKKLETGVNKVDRLNELFNSINVEKALYETGKLETTVKETREIVQKISNDYVVNTSK